ncbi:uncharacterized protein LOC129961698 [Argiope bruennichi]|uniref:uncharacterized protein LOC129961698 n=1 Tax=Argiope bruennichi TaxID=94029 RepID=UPI0024950553|nr:uncharacterized protein LOC129961698 [Argiope bruennichi]
MSEESNVNVSSTEKGDLEDGTMNEDNSSKSTLHSEEPAPTEYVNEPTEQEHVQENRQPIEVVQSEDQNGSIALGSPETNIEPVDSTSEQQLTTSEASIETESSEKTNFDQPAVKSTSSEISISLVSSSDKALEEVSENIQLIYEGLKDMKISTQNNPGSASSTKGRKPASTPRAKSTPVKQLPSPPLTRSRSRDLRKFPSTPSSPGRSAGSDSDEVKRVRGRQRVKKD